MYSWFTRLKLYIINRIFHFIPFLWLARSRPVFKLEETVETVKNSAPKGILPPNFNEIIDVPNVTRGKCRWFAKVDDIKPEDPVMIFFHGGGYAFNMEREHADLIKLVWHHSRNKRLNIVWLDYTLSLHARFPQQLIEAASVFDTLGKTYKNLLLLGDSAGGHLAISLLRHLETPFKGVPAVTTKVRPNTFIGVSPWLEWFPDAEDINSSSYKHHYRDVFTAKALRDFAEHVMPDEDAELAADISNMYCRRDINWKAVLPKNILVTYGKHEVLHDSIVEFAKVANVEEIAEIGIVYGEEGGPHDSPIMVSCERNPIVHTINGFMDQVLA